jgi:TolA-binding protein
MSRWQKIILFALLCISGANLFASSASERREFDAAARAFNMGSFPYAETNFARFIQKYSNSELLPEAILRQAQARFYLNDYDGAISLLSTNETKAGFWADHYAYWIGESQLAEENFSAAADSFDRVIQNFPVSTNRLAASVREAEARTHLKQWPRVVELLQSKDGAFQQAIRAGATNETAATGFLLLGEAQLTQRNFGDAGNTLALLVGFNLNPTLAWRRSYLKCRLEMAEGNLQELAASTTNLLARAAAAKDLKFTAESVALRADVLERLGSLDQAIDVYRRNLSPEVPAERQREAALKIVELSLAMNKISEAVETLGNFLNQNTNAAATDIALLKLGELRLKLFLSGTNTPGILDDATAGFERLIREFPNSPFLGEAWLDKGWCLWLQKKYADSESAFQNAAMQLRPSEEQAVARFKWADAQFMRNDFAGAITNYDYVEKNLGTLPKVKERLLELALYQIVRSALPIGDFNAATNALEKILAQYPEGFAGGDALGARAVLLTGEEFAQHDDPERARELFSRFEELYPTNSFTADVRLAIARTFEREKNWDAAITNYEAWTAAFTNHAQLAAAQFGRAWDNYMAGRDTNAFALFTNFVARFPTNRLALQAQWWIGDYCFRSNDWVGAETAYQLVFRNTNWPPSELSYQAEMMAGRAAMARQAYTPTATNYFSELAGNTNCPLDLRLQASFACGDALMSRSDPDATNHDSDLKDAIDWFSSIPKKYPTSDAAPLAWGRVGDCYLQRAASGTNLFYDLASNAYQQVLNLPQASLSARCQAKVGLGMIAEKIAKQKSGDDQAALFQQALNDYQDVFLGNNLKDGEHRDLFWVKEAGLRAFTVASEDLGDWPLAFNICTNIAESAPPLRAIFETKMAKAREHLVSEKK